MEANLHNNPNRDVTKYSRALYRVTVNFYKKIRSLQNLVYGKAFLLHWTSSCEKAQPFDKHLVGLGLWTKKEKNISVLLPQTDIGRWAYCLFLIPTSTEVCASARKKKTFVPPPHHFQLLTNQHMTHRPVMNDGIKCVVVLEPFTWNIFGSTVFTSCCLFLSILQNEIWKRLWLQIGVKGIKTNFHYTSTVKAVLYEKLNGCSLSVHKRKLPDGKTSLT